MEDSVYNESESDFLTPYFNAIENQTEYNADEMFLINTLQINNAILTGSIKNISQEAFSSVTLTINIYDTNNALIGSAYPTVHGVIRPGDSFALNFYLPEVSSIETYNAMNAKFAEVIEYNWYY